MPSIHVVTGSAPGSLLELAAGPFLDAAEATGPFASPPCLLVLRQGGLRDDLYRLAAGRGVRGWFDPPLCVFHELPAWLGTTSRIPLKEFERAALVAGSLRDHGGPTFHHRANEFAGAVEQLFGELRAEAVAPDQFAAAVSRLGPREAFQEQRDADLVRAYAAYVAELDRLGRRDGRDTLVDCALALGTDPSRCADRLAGRREIRIFGLADLRGGWRIFLPALKASPALDRVILYTASKLPFPPGLVDSWESVPGPKSPAVKVIAEPDPDRELEAISSQIRDLIEGGVPADRIAVVPRQARPYADWAIRALARAGIPATSRRRIAWREVPCIRALLALIAAAADGWTRHGLAELGAQSYFASEIDERVVNFIGFRERITGLAAWQTAFERLLAESRAAEATPEGEEGERRPPTLPAEWVERAAARFRSFAEVASAIETERTLIDWIEWWSRWLEQDPWEIERSIARVREDRWEIARIDLLAWRGLRVMLGEWLEAERQWPGPSGPLAPREFLVRIRAMLAGDLALTTGPARGVQVIEAQAASHRSFDHLFLVGMNLGRFPRRAPSSLLLGEQEREALRAAGLPLDNTAEWDTRERELFEALVNGAKQEVTLSYTTLDETGADAIPSSFIALAGGRAADPSNRRDLPALPFPGSADLLEHARRTAEIERDRVTGRLSPWNGAIEDESLRAWLAQEFGEGRVWSPTGIEEYAKCPWAWFSRRLLRLDERNDPDEDIDPKARGTVLHDALRRFYDGARDRVGGPVFLQPSDRAWAEGLLRVSLAEALAEAQSAVWLGHPALRPVKQAELERMLLRFLAFEIEENRKTGDGRTTAGKMVRTAVAAHEVRFEDVVLERDGVRFQFRGIMDRIEVGMDDRAPGNWVAAVDYKTTKYACPGAGDREAWDDGVVLQVPLYAWALQVLRPEAQVARVEYRAIRHVTRVHLLGLVRVSKGGVAEAHEEQARMERALQAVAGHVRGIRGGEFPARPAPSCRCPAFCHGWDVCRVKDGPQTGA